MKLGVFVVDATTLNNCLGLDDQHTVLTVKQSVEDRMNRRFLVYVEGPEMPEHNLGEGVLRVAQIRRPNKP